MFPVQAKPFVNLEETVHAIKKAIAIESNQIPCGLSD